MPAKVPVLSQLSRLKLSVYCGWLDRHAGMQAGSWATSTLTLLTWPTSGRFPVGAAPAVGPSTPTMRTWLPARPLQLRPPPPPQLWQPPRQLRRRPGPPAQSTSTGRQSRGIYGRGRQWGAPGEALRGRRRTRGGRRVGGSRSVRTAGGWARVARAARNLNHCARPACYRRRTGARLPFALCLTFQHAPKAVDQRERA